MSSVTEQARKQANLRLLQRTCSSDISDIVQTATHVVLYEYVDVAWQKSGVEGSLFLAQTSSTYVLVILNRHNTENFVMDVTFDMQMQHQDPYLIFKQKQDGGVVRIRGIWFHNADERVAMAAAVQQSIQRLAQYGGRLPVSSPPPPVPVPPASQPPTDAAATATLTALLSPMAVSVAQQQQQQSFNTTTPARSTSSNDSANSTSSPRAVALDKKSLQLALLSLIQDDRFLDLLHSQYLRVVHARTKKGGTPQNDS